MGGFVSTETARFLDKQKHSPAAGMDAAGNQATAGALRVLEVTSVVSETAKPYRYKANIRYGQYTAAGASAVVYATGVDLFSGDPLSVGAIVHAVFSHGDHWEAISFKNRFGYCWILSGTSGVEMTGIDSSNPFYKLYKYPCKISPILEPYSPWQDSFLVSNRMVEAFNDTAVMATLNGDFWLADGFLSIPIAYSATMRGRLRKVSMSQGSHSFASDIDTGDVQVSFSNAGGMARYVSADNLSGFYPMKRFQQSGMVSLAMHAIYVPFGSNYEGGIYGYQCSMSELLEGTMKSSVFTDRDGTAADSAFSLFNRSIHVSSLLPS